MGILNRIIMIVIAGCKRLFARKGVPIARRTKTIVKSQSSIASSAIALAPAKKIDSDNAPPSRVEVASVVQAHDLEQSDIERSFRTGQLRLGHQLGRAGGQGSVFELVDYAGFVCKMYSTPLGGPVQSLYRLVDFGKRCSAVLANAGVVVAWPIVVLSKDGKVHGYVMRKAPRQFRLVLKTPYGDRETDATLDQLIVPPERPFSPKDCVTIAAKISILTRVAFFLDFLHRNDLVYGDISFKNMMFSMNPIQLFVMDVDGVRGISDDLNPVKDLLHTPDWNDPFMVGRVPIGFDLDRYRFALMVYRLLFSESHSDPLENFTHSNLILDRNLESHGALRFVLSRAASSRSGSRPPINEWLAALRSYVV